MSFIDNQIVSEAETSYRSDADGFGNLVKEMSLPRGQVQNFGYRLDGKLVSYSGSGSSGNSRFDEDRDRGESFHGRNFSVKYDFDALGRRVAKEIRMTSGRERPEGSGSFTQTYSYLSGENKILLAKAGNGELTLYLDGQGIDEHLGEVSRHGALGFAIYLSHFVFIKLLDWRIRVFPDSIAQNPYIYTFSAVALTLIATELSHLVEKHYIERGKRVTTEILRSARATLPGLATG